jgi:hypothetical protein
MTTEEILKICAALIGSVGGAALIIVGLSSWLGKVWANRILEKDKLHYQGELESIKQQLQIASQKEHTVFSRYYEGQFRIYNELWVALVELESGVDALWSDASRGNLRMFESAARKAKRKIRESALLIDPEHYTEIMGALQDIKEYRQGKEHLILERRRIDQMDDSEIAQIVERNRDNRDKIKNFTSRIMDGMRAQIGGKIATP